MPFIHGIRHEGNFRAELLLSPDPDSVIQDFLSRKADIALVPALAVQLLADARMVTEYCVGGVPSCREGLLSSTDPLVEGWKDYGELPFAFAMWVAHAEVDADTVESLQHALTYGLEHGYEALLDSPFVAAPRAPRRGLRGGLRGAAAVRLHFRQPEKSGAPKVLGLGCEGRPESQSRLKRVSGRRPPL